MIKLSQEGNPGDLAIIFGFKKNRVIGVGLFDPNSSIRIKMLYNGGGKEINDEFFSERINEAYSLRIPLLEKQTNSYRLIHGENDGFPGLIADVYNKVLVIKIYSEIWIPYMDMLTKRLVEVSKAECAILRLSRKLQNIKGLYGYYEGMTLFGNLENEVVSFQECGVNFSANVIKGHKTGHFLDHRHNRRRVGELSKDKTVLDVFSYSGGFSVHALVNGAKEVTSIDVSSQALEIAKKNVRQNSFFGTHNTIIGDAFTIMEQLISEMKTFDVVVIDPPSFAKSKKEIIRAKKKYSALARLGIKLTAPKGLLVLASCSPRIVAKEFFEIIEKVLKEEQRHYSLIHTAFHDIDHPITFKEGAYLKSGYYRFSK